jgi:uncharacterized phiE125 gp8 family phage protein
MTLISLNRTDNLNHNLISLEEVKIYLKIDSNLEDSLLGNLILSAIKSCEEYTNLSLGRKCWHAIYKTASNFSEIILPRKPVHKVIELGGLYHNGEKSKLNYTHYYLIDSRVIFKQNPFFNHIYIDFEAGYLEQIPSELKINIFEHVAEMYEKRNISSDFLSKKYNRSRGMKL